MSFLFPVSVLDLGWGITSFRPVSAGGGWQSRRLDIPQLPSEQDAQKKQDRQTHAPSECVGHAFTFGLVILTIAQHEEKGRAQADQDGKKSKHYEDFHPRHYPVTAGQSHSRGWRFWALTAAALAGISLTSRLGFWQLDRAAQKEALQAATQARALLPPLSGADIAVRGDAQAVTTHVHRSVALQGQWLPQYTVFLDNRQMQARPGFFVLTPLQLAGRPEVVLVQRGWVPRNFQQRTQLPTIETPRGTIEVLGRVALPPSKLFEFAGAPPVQGSSRIRQNLDLPTFRDETGLPLADATVLQTGEPSEGLQRDWPAVNSGVEKNYGYAFQWFGLSSLIAILYVWFQFVRRLFRSRRSTAL